jgi:hypothetical protein
MEASPSLWFALPIVQAVRVRKPPLMRSISSGASSRAPRRIKTLSCSFILFSFRHFGSVGRAQALQKTFGWPPISKNIDAAGFSLNKISVPVGIAAAVAIAWTGNSGSSHDGRAYIRVGLHGSADLIDFINRQLTSAGTRQDSVVFLSRHTFFSFSFCYIRSPALQLRYGHAVSDQA